MNDRDSDYPFEATIRIFTIVTALGIALLFIPISSEICPKDCIRQKCRMYTVGTGEVSKGPCQCLKENTDGTTSTFCTFTTTLEHPTFNEMIDEPLFYDLFCLFLGLVCVTVSFALYEAHEAGILNLARLFRRKQKFEGEPKVSKSD